MLPIVIDFSYLSGKADASIRRLYDDGRPNILFVGRMAPNKCVEELILAFAWYHRAIERRSIRRSRRRR